MGKFFCSTIVWSDPVRIVWIRQTGFAAFVYSIQYSNSVRIYVRNYIMKNDKKYPNDRFIERIRCLVILSTIILKPNFDSIFKVLK